MSLKAELVNMLQAERNGSGKKEVSLGLEGTIILEEISCNVRSPLDSLELK